jgi:hydrogenase expression/formation protein HypE
MEDNILLAHGNGGKLTSQLIETCFLPYFQDPLLNQLNDQAIIDLEGCRIALTTDSFVVDPLFFPGGDIGKLAVCGTVNDLAVGGATSLYLSVGFIIEENFPIEELKKISSSISTTAKEAQVRIVTADTKVVEKGACDKLFINTSGIGIVEKGVDFSGHNAREGDKILLSGDIGDHGIAILSSRKGIEFETTVKSDCAPLNLLVNDLLPHAGHIHAMRDLTRGGLGTILNEIASQSGLAITIHEDRIPIKQEVRGMCELLGLDPLYLANEGKLIAFIHPDMAEEVLSSMKKNPLGKNACIIGEVVREPFKKVTLETKVGGSRFIEILVGEDLPRIC